MLFQTICLLPFQKKKKRRFFCPFFKYFRFFFLFIYPLECACDFSLTRDFSSISFEYFVMHYKHHSFILSHAPFLLQGSPLNEFIFSDFSSWSRTITQSIWYEWGYSFTDTMCTSVSIFHFPSSYGCMLSFDFLFLNFVLLLIVFFNSLSFWPYTRISTHGQWAH